jgi:hypothetical protein
MHKAGMVLFAANLQTSIALGFLVGGPWQHRAACWACDAASTVGMNPSA